MKAQQMKERYREDPAAALVTLLKLTERYGVVFQTLASTPGTDRCQDPSG